jgi:hypothetical protein
VVSESGIKWTETEDVSEIEVGKGIGNETGVGIERTIRKQSGADDPAAEVEEEEIVHEVEAKTVLGTDVEETGRGTLEETGVFLSESM